MFLVQMVTVWLVLVEPTAYTNSPRASMLWVPFLIGWAQGLRYLGVIRSDSADQFPPKGVGPEDLPTLQIPIAKILNPDSKNTLQVAVQQS
ncbi:hypothetical protein [Streptomyces sp. NPDC050738]|uniref:hypothetical protein n=1 Tax=Streptomyces sp. NPDC050738 TaxID=3154744 RepID=UPI003435247B